MVRGVSTIPTGLGLVGDNYSLYHSLGFRTPSVSATASKPPCFSIALAQARYRGTISLGEVDSLQVKGSSDDHRRKEDQPRSDPHSIVPAAWKMRRCDLTSGMKSKEIRYKRWSMHRDPGLSTQLVIGAILHLPQYYPVHSLSQMCVAGMGPRHDGSLSTCLVPRLRRVLQLLFAVAGIVLAAP